MASQSINKNGVSADPERSTKTRSEQLADLLVRQVLSGVYPAGSRLPSERDLAAQHEVSRASVREAVKRLDQIGLVDVRPGGARILPVEEATLDVVSHLIRPDAPDLALADQILQVMSALMTLAARSAVANATHRDIDELRTLVASLKSDALEPHERIDARMRMSQRFMDLSGNLVLQLISNSLRMQFMQDRDERPEMPPEPRGYALQLEALDEGLQNRDGQAVANAMQRIFDATREIVREELQLRAAEHSAEQAAKQTSQTPYLRSPVQNAGHTTIPQGA